MESSNSTPCNSSCSSSVDACCSIRTGCCASPCLGSANQKNSRLHSASTTTAAAAVIKLVLWMEPLDMRQTDSCPYRLMLLLSFCRSPLQRIHSSTEHCHAQGSIFSPRLVPHVCNTISATVVSTARCGKAPNPLFEKEFTAVAHGNVAFWRSATVLLRLPGGAVARIMRARRAKFLREIIPALTRRTYLATCGTWQRGTWQRAGSNSALELLKGDILSRRTSDQSL